MYCSLGCISCHGCIFTDLLRNDTVCNFHEPKFATSAQITAPSIQFCTSKFLFNFANLDQQSLGMWLISGGWHTLCFPVHSAPWNTLLQSGLVHFASQHTLLPDTLYSLAHFTPQHTLLPGILFYSAQFASWNTLLPRTLCFLCSREQSILQRTFYKGATCSRAHSVPRSRVFEEANCAGEQSVSGNKVF